MFPTGWGRILREKGQGTKLRAHRTIILDDVDTDRETHFKKAHFPVVLSPSDFPNNILCALVI
jgi:hypothetical protein